MYRRLFLVTCLCVTSLQAERKNIMPDFDDGVVSFYLDNDIFAGSDENYTNGGRIAWISGRHRRLVDISPIQRYLDKFTGSENSHGFMQDIWGFKNLEDVSYQYGMALTQQMFTPESLDAIPPPGQRPYAGWLGLGFSLHLSGERAINSVEFTVGTVGPHSYAEATQDFIHDLREIDKFNGWDRQIPNEITLNMNFSHKRRYRYLNGDELNDIPVMMDGFTNFATSLGNHRTDLSIGWHTHIGLNIPVNFSDPRLSPTANSVCWCSEGQSTDWSAYFIAGVRGSVVLHDITLDGPVFRDFDTGVKREPFVGEVYGGVGVRYKNMEFSYIQTLRTKEFKEQRDHQNFGSFVVRLHY